MDFEIKIMTPAERSYRLKRSRSLPGISPPWKLCSRQS